jgi:glycosyltransferase involved in cell wall biosynthesis
MTFKLAQVCPGYYPYIGGIETLVREISESLVRQGIDVEILTVDLTGKLPAEEHRNGVSIKRFKGWAPGGRYYSSRSLKHYLKQNSSRYDVVHAHNYMALPALYAVHGRDHNSLVFSPHYHGTSHNYISQLLRVPYGFVWARLLHNIDKFVFVSDAEKLIFRKKFSVPNEKITVIPNSIDTENIRAARAYPSENRIILYVGRLEKYKNIQLIIKALPYLDETYSLVIVGSGLYKNELVQLGDSLGVQGRIKILSGLEDEAVRAWYKTCSVFVTLSESEAFGRTVIEALSAGKPVVASDIPPFLELAARLNGIRLVKIPGVTPRKLANTIIESGKSSPPNNDLEAYSWNTITKSIKQVYMSVLTGKG